MEQEVVQRRLTEVHQRLVKARQELAIVEEQLTVFDETADDARIRSLVSETPLANHDWNEARRHADAMRRGRDDAQARVAELERAQDELLAKLVV
ncbi:MAG TPA: hypothetical protein VKA05_05605 [Acidimicrobiales bacterium]|nr:hypothetical protein [Acidimicrobiales bacterium]